MVRTASADVWTAFAACWRPCQRLRSCTYPCLRTTVALRPQRCSARDEQGASAHHLIPLIAQERLEQIKVEVSNQLALANAQELVNVRRTSRPRLTLQTLTNKCYKACVPKPSTSLSSGEERCLERCQGAHAVLSHQLTRPDRFLESCALT